MDLGWLGLMFSRNLKKYFIGNRKIEPGNDSFGQVSGYPDTRIPGYLAQSYSFIYKHFT